MYGALLLSTTNYAIADVIIGNIKVKDDGAIVFSDSSQQSTATLQGPAGPQGPGGAAGPQGPAGPASATGYNSLIQIIAESAGYNCTNGGSKIIVGLDQNRSNALECNEVLQTNYMCNGATSITPTPSPITVTASPSTQTFGSFATITATIKFADGTPVSGNVNFSTSGGCWLSSGSVASEFLHSGIASTSVFYPSMPGASYPYPCIVYAEYINPTTQTIVSGSTMVTFVPDSGTTPVTPTPSPITVTASPSTQTFGSFATITATIKFADGTPLSGNVDFSTSGGGGSCWLSSGSVASESLHSGIASTPVFSSSGGPYPYPSPCIVYAEYYNPSTQTSVSGSTMVTFVSKTASIAVTASTSAQTFNSFVNITATVKYPDDSPGTGAVNFRTSGSCLFFKDNNPSNYTSESVTGGIASVAVTDTNNIGSPSPCIVYAEYNNPSTYPTTVSGSTLVTFAPQN
jgi:hypothetical protein